MIHDPLEIMGKLEKKLGKPREIMGKLGKK